MTVGTRRAETACTRGGWLALASEQVWMLADVDPLHPAVKTWFDTVHGGARADGLLELLVQEGFRLVPSFAIVEYDTTNGEGTISLRGAVIVHVFDRAGAERELRAPVATTWERHPLGETAGRVILAAPVTDDSVQFQLAVGTTTASSLCVTFVDAAAPAPKEQVQPEPSPMPRPPVEMREERRVPAFPLSASARADRREAESAARVVERALPVAQSEEIPSAAQTVPDVVTPSVGAEPPSFDHLFGATQQGVPAAELRPVDRPVEVQRADVTTRPPTEATQVFREVDVPVPLTAAPSPDPAAGTAESGDDGLISSVPWVTDGGSHEPPPVLPPGVDVPSLALAAALHPPTDPAAPWPPESRMESESPSIVEETVNRAALLAATTSPVPAGPTVKAVRCVAGHLSPPTASLCRTCGAELAQQEAFTAPRPPLGVLRLSTGDVITLDRGVVLGRAPEYHGPNTAERPNLVKLASPEKDISRTHLSVRLDGWHVLVVDHDSTNGTTVTLPGQPPQMLRPNDPLTIEPGSVVNLADEIQLRYEVVP